MSGFVDMCKQRELEFQYLVRDYADLTGESAEACVDPVAVMVIQMGLRQMRKAIDENRKLGELVFPETEKP